MKDKHSTDPLDATIDSLLRVQPLKAPDDLPERVLTAAQQASHEQHDARQSYPMGKRPLYCALPLAAVLALAFILWPGMQTPENAPSLSYDEAQEILRMEASLQALIPLQDDENFTANGLLATFETATYAL